MIICIDFDGTVVRQNGRAYDDTTTPLELMPGAREALLALKRAGHKLVLWSARASPALRTDWRTHPIWRAYADEPTWWASSRELNERRYQQMLAFVRTELPDVFDAVDDGRAGKMSAALYIDDKAVPYGIGELPANGVDWQRIARTLGQDRGTGDTT